ncbi:MAG TPA: HupE/UreJ family protein [Kofleriaceae bacterium]|nr:HupE/UreJ family protein [Kofleriaceae bacterium]
MTRAAARLAFLAGALLLLAPASAAAHDFNPGVLALVETGEQGRFAMQWTPPVDSTGSEAEVGVTLPADCRQAGDRKRVDCGAGGLAGTIAFRGMDSPRMKVVVYIRWLDGSESEQIVTGAEPRLDVERRPHRSLLPWVRLGVEHILLGFDHLAFLLGMLLVLNLALDRRLVATITAFTAAHSLSLALAVTGVVRVPSAPVEALIAASVVLVAREALGERPTATRRWPWLVAGLFGLVHGLGFAGALAELGLPSGAIGISLLGFNLGVELGQLAVVAAAVALARLAGVRRAGSVLERHGRARRAQRGMAYVLGALGTAWFLAQGARLLVG